MQETYSSFIENFFLLFEYELEWHNEATLKNPYLALKVDVVNLRIL
jgi:hypothetical protein